VTRVALRNPSTSLQPPPGTARSWSKCGGIRAERESSASGAPLKAASFETCTSPEARRRRAPASKARHRLRMANDGSNFGARPHRSHSLAWMSGGPRRRPRITAFHRSPAAGNGTGKFTHIAFRKFPLHPQMNSL
jgi:hypothetical protein